MFPHSIRAINDLPEAEKHAIYSTLLPEWLSTEYKIDLQTLTYDGYPVVYFQAKSGTRAVEVTVKRHEGDSDPMLYLNMVDTFQ